MCWAVSQTVAVGPQKTPALEKGGVCGTTIISVLHSRAPSSATQGSINNNAPRVLIQRVYVHTTTATPQQLGNGLVLRFYSAASVPSPLSRRTEKKLSPVSFLWGSRDRIEQATATSLSVLSSLGSLHTTTKKKNPNTKPNQTQTVTSTYEYVERLETTKSSVDARLPPLSRHTAHRH